MSTISDNILLLKQDLDSVYEEGRRCGYDEGCQEGPSYDKGFNEGQVSLVKNTEYLQEEAYSHKLFLSDISSVTHPLDIQLFGGKNLFNNDTSKMKHIGYWNSVGDFEYKGYELKFPIGTYTAHVELKEGQSLESHERYLYCFIVRADGARESTMQLVGASIYYNQTFSMNKGDKLYVYDAWASNSLSKSRAMFQKFNIQIEEGTTATPYTPFIDLFTIKTGKNLFDNDTEKIDGIGYINEQYGYEYKGYEIYLPAGTYTAHAELKEGQTLPGHSYLYGFIIRGDGSKEKLNPQLLAGTIDTFRDSTFSIGEEDILYLYNGASSASLEATRSLFDIFNIQIEEGSEFTGYSPYVEVPSVTLTRRGKNLFDISQVESIESTNSSLINNQDGTLTVYVNHGGGCVDGKSHKLRDYAPGLEVGKTYRLSFHSVNTATEEESHYQLIYLGAPYDNRWETSQSLTITEEMLSSPVNWYSDRTGTTSTISNIQIEEGTEVTDYEPYHTPTEYIPRADGVVEGVTSVYPTTILETNIPDSISIWCRYSRDLAVVPEGQELYNAFWDCQQENGEKEDYSRFFQNGWNDEICNPKWLMRVSNGLCMFQKCKVLDLRKCIGNKLDTYNCSDFSYMFSECLSYTTPKVKIPAGLDLSKLDGMYAWCPNLTSIEIELSEGVGEYPSNMFEWGNNITEFKVTGIIANGGLDLSKRMMLSKDNVKNVFACLSDETEGLPIIFSRTCIQKAFETRPDGWDGLSSAEWSALLASKPNWTVVIHPDV